MAQVEQQVFGGGTQAMDRPARPLWPAMKRGFFGRCPNCGEGKLFRAFTKPVDTCDFCHEDLSHSRADDLPAYLVIVIVGHLVVGGFMAMEASIEMSTLAYLAIWIPVTLILAIGLLQPVKGAVIGLQWALYMHGFGGETDHIEAHPEA
jgi:uncharacterized protein (DUF983 family)